jgi:hypothetical protein
VVVRVCVCVFACERARVCVPHVGQSLLGNEWNEGRPSITTPPEGPLPSDELIISCNDDNFTPILAVGQTGMHCTLQVRSLLGLLRF